MLKRGTSLNTGLKDQRGLKALITISLGHEKHTHQTFKKYLWVTCQSLTLLLNRFFQVNCICIHVYV